MGIFDSFARRLFERGPLWTGLHIARRTLRRAAEHVDDAMLRLERRRLLTGDDTVLAARNTVAENRALWNGYDWSRGGDEWTADAQRLRGLDPAAWKAALVDGMLSRYLGAGGVVLEVGPGAGRWTTFLAERADRLILADISEVCLALCRARFGDRPGVELMLTDGRGVPRVTDDSVDFIWSYDVFVHINPGDTDAYLADFARVLKRGGKAVIHHADCYASAREARAGFRSACDARMFAHFVRRHGMTIIEQNRALAHHPGDIITVFSKP